MSVKLNTSCETVMYLWFETNLFSVYIPGQNLVSSFGYFFAFGKCLNDIYSFFDIQRIKKYSYPKKQQYKIRHETPISNKIG